MVTVCDCSKSGLCNKNNGMSGTEIKIMCCAIVCCIKAKKDKNEKIDRCKRAILPNLKPKSKEMK